MKSKNLLYLGRVIKAHGVKGDILVNLNNENIKFTNDLKEIWLGETPGHMSSWEIEELNRSDDKVFLKLRNVETPEEANFLKALDVFLPEEMVEEKSIFDTIGFKLLDDDTEEIIGIVKEILEGPMQDVIVFDKDNDEKMVPVVEEFIKYIDWEKNEIFVKIIEGLI
eukprot:Anaeramoba_ignava/a496_42.p3 GENE.a496_42~~a496_42.p3  ORF type:complete len:167 (+),score=26.88 a496_42:2235-2735(+)